VLIKFYFYSCEEVAVITKCAYIQVEIQWD